MSCPQSKMALGAPGLWCRAGLSQVDSQWWLPSPVPYEQASSESPHLPSRKCGSRRAVGTRGEGVPGRGTEQKQSWERTMSCFISPPTELLKLEWIWLVVRKSWINVPKEFYSFLSLQCPHFSEQTQKMGNSRLPSFLFPSFFILFFFFLKLLFPL